MSKCPFSQKLWYHQLNVISLKLHRKRRINIGNFLLYIGFLQCIAKDLSILEVKYTTFIEQCFIILYINCLHLLCLPNPSPFLWPIAPAMC